MIYYSAKMIGLHPSIRFEWNGRKLSDDKYYIPLHKWINCQILFLVENKNVISPVEVLRP